MCTQTCSVQVSQATMCNVQVAKVSNKVNVQVSKMKKLACSVQVSNCAV